MQNWYNNFVNWYNGITIGQRIIVWIATVSGFFALFIITRGEAIIGYFFGLLFWGYLELGRRKLKETSKKDDIPFDVP